MTPIAQQDPGSRESSTTGRALPATDGAVTSPPLEILGPATFGTGDLWVGAALFLGTFLLLLGIEEQVGFPRDESVYFEAARSYGAWFRLLFTDPLRAVQDAEIAAAWRYNAEHPALLKSLFALSGLLFHDTLGWLRPATAFRLPAFAFTALIPALTYRMGVGIWGRAVGLFAGVSFLLVPRQLFNGVLACFDVPVATLWLLVVLLFWRSASSARAGIGCGIAFGLALATKHNALFLPLVLVPFALWSSFSESRAHPEARRRLLQLVGLFALVALLYGLTALLLGPDAFQARMTLLSPQTLYFVGLAVGGGLLLRELRRLSPGTFRAALPVWTMAIFGPALFYVLWPWLWHHPVDRAAWYLAFHARHEHYAWFYLGSLLREPPFPLAYVVVKTALTVPTSLFVPMAIGWLWALGRALWPLLKRDGTLAPLTRAEALVLVNATVPLLIISHPQVPHFGGVKHWFPAMPFLALLAGVALVRAAQTLQQLLAAKPPSRQGATAAFAALSVLVLLPAAWSTAHFFPYGTAAYSELAGGAPGAASLGMQRQFWSSHVTGVLPWLNAHAPQGARVWLHEVRHESFRDYQENGMLRADLQPARGPEDAVLAAYQYHQEFRFQEFDIWRAFETTRPVTGLSIDATPQVVVYRLSSREAQRRPRPNGAAPAEP